MKYFVVIDGGTQNVKAFVFDSKGNEVASEAHPVNPYFATQPDFAEQHAEEYLDIARMVTRNAVAGSGVSRSDLAAVAVTTHRSTVIPVDEEGRPVRPAITWLDERKTEGLKLPGGPLFDVAFRVMGMRRKLVEYQRRSKFNWLREHEPESYHRTFMFLTTSSYLFHALTGEFKDCSSMIVGLFPIDLKKQEWHGWSVVYEIFGVDKDRLPPLVSPIEVAGEISAKGEEDFGLPSGLPVIIGAGDKQSELLGAGVADQEAAEISYGTAAVIEMLTSRYVTHPEMDFFTWGAAIPQHWALEGFIGRGYWMVSWFMRELARDCGDAAGQSGITPEEWLDRLAQEVPAGSMGLVLQPYWHPRENDPLSKGAILGFSGEHRRPHIYRAIIEGIAYELRRLGDLMQDKMGHRIRGLRVGGGGSNSDQVMQITADIFNLPATRLHTSNLAALGAAIDGAVALNIYDSFEQAITSMVRASRTFEPDAQNVAIYDRLYNEVYLRMYSALSPLHRRIADITGYPRSR